MDTAPDILALKSELLSLILEKSSKHYSLIHELYVVLNIPWNSSLVLSYFELYSCDGWKSLQMNNDG